MAVLILMHRGGFIQRFAHTLFGKHGFNICLLCQQRRPSDRGTHPVYAGFIAHHTRWSGDVIECDQRAFVYQNLLK
jgi:hypothetical protein